MFLEAEKEAAFPSARMEGYRVTSSETSSYNCVAWALSDKEKWWQPFPSETDQFWPESVPESYDAVDFAEMYKIVGGYQESDSIELEEGFEKIAIYADKRNEFRHVARQLENGKWTSKLGDWEDIEHNTLKALESPQYGSVKILLKRRRIA